MTDKDDFAGYLVALTVLLVALWIVAQLLKGFLR